MYCLILPYVVARLTYKSKNREVFCSSIETALRQNLMPHTSWENKATITIFHAIAPRQPSPVVWHERAALGYQYRS